MDENTKKQIQLLLAEIVNAQNLSNTPASPDEYYKIAQSILGNMAYFVGLLIDAEQAFEQRKVELRNEGMSVAAAENQAKSEPVYATFKKAKYAYELGGEQVMLLKKMLTARDSEYQNN